MSIKKFIDVLINSGVTTSVLLLIIGMANIFAWVLTAEQIPGRIASGLLSITSNPYMILLLINAFLLFAGMFLEGGRPSSSWRRPCWQSPKAWASNRCISA